MLALRLPAELEQRLEDLARKTGRTKSFYAREAIVEHIDDLEDLYLVRERLSDDPEYVSFDEVVENLGLDPADLKRN
ncbi:DUF6290 family protein [Tianweitania populi]|uniref:CopG family transcriptional regulator n=1 Tax=Tianweitania populi TaxID=1607949 RepID=A0A8J3DVX5_9HYPH|nr:DUF6290 family protein [Tianweitania populi]GHD11094.1 CopG family transcriptional regulator [Tianweitania populi]